MCYFHLKRVGIMVTLGVVALTFAVYVAEPAKDIPPLYQKPAGHGLRIYIDPQTGQYAPPPPEPVATMQPNLSGQAYLAPDTPPLLESPSNGAAGGYSIDLQEYFRPRRQQAGKIKDDS